MKKLRIEKLVSIEGGITCDNMFAVAQYLLVNNPAQYQSLVNLSSSGVTFQCTNSASGSTTNYSFK